MIALIASDYGYGPEITKNLTDEVLRDTCNSSTPYLYLKNLILFLAEQNNQLEKEKAKELRDLLDEFINN